MKSPSHLHYKTILLISIMVILGPLGNTCLSKGMKRIGAASTWTPPDFLRIFFRIMTSGYIWLGITCLLSFFVAYLVVLSWADYSYVQPASSFAFGVVALFGYLLLGEVVAPLHWIGVAVICAGVLVVGGTPPRTTEKH